MHVLETQELTKDFGQNRGVFDLDISLQAGEIVGFVGPNGAGKSTAINLLAGLIKPNKGAVRLFGETVTMNSVYHVMPKIGLLLSESTLDQNQTPETMFKQSQALLGINVTKHWTAMSRELELDTTKQIKQLSLGNKKKVGIVNALMHSPKLVIMDEPTSGLDPLMQSKFATLLSQVKQRGGTVFLSSHDLSEVQQVCDRIIMIRQGKVIVSEYTNTLIDRARKLFILNQPPKALVQQLSEITGVEIRHKTVLQAELYAQDHQALIRQLSKANFYDFYVERPTLEEMFREYYLS